MKKHFSMFAVSALIFGSVMGFVTAVAAADPIADRVHGFKASKHSVEDIKDDLNAGDILAISALANSLADFGARIPSLFPPGSNQGKTDARSEIWTNFPDFEGKAKTFETSARELADLTKTGTADKAQVAGTFAKVVDSCKSCHRSYKED
ncbi:MAG TPA: cytochrome c [Candidatus Sulfotelmatobacter sp.]|jgi:cytochrome c556|nr:cytochrome c [Candidatus Sulfotelmatobacter sp.]